MLKLVSLKASLNWGLSEKLKEAFPGIIPAIRPPVLSTEIKDINWLRGFAEGEGCFQVVIQKYKDKTSVSLRFTLTQHSRDKELFDGKSS